MHRAPHIFDFKAGKFIGWKQTGREGELGLFKNEKVGTVEQDDEMVEAEERIVRYAGSEAKTYATVDYRYVGKERVFAGAHIPAKCKGVPKYALDKKQIFEQIKDAAQNSTVYKATFNAIRTKGAVASHQSVTKVFMRGVNNKVVRFPDDTCVQHGHYRCG
jgi:hypothetical protein